MSGRIPQNRLFGRFESVNKIATEESEDLLEKGCLDPNEGMSMSPPAVL